MSASRVTDQNRGWRVKAIGPADDPLMLRYALLRTPWGHLYLHKFLRSDRERDLHDHPFAFVTLPLWRGYIEELPVPCIHRMLLAGVPGYTVADTIRVRRWPLIPLFRPARWTHRVEVVRGKPAWSLIWTARINGRKERNWGFYTRAGWVAWRDYVAELASKGVAV